MRILIVIASFFSLISMVAQGNLQFNQVITLTGTLTTSPVTLGTVPSGKVWKIEHNATHRNGYPAWVSFVCSGTPSYGNFSQVSTTGQTHADGAIWLKSGDYIEIQYGSVNYPASYFFSILEFNIVP